MATVFISYSRKDTEFVRSLYSALAERGLEGWVDWEGIPPADDWLRKIHGAIEGVDAFLLVMSPDSLASEVCGNEVAHAISHNKRIVPVVWREVNRLDHPDIEIPEALRRLNWIFFRPGDDFDAGAAKTVAAVRTDLEWVESHTRLLGRAIEWDRAGRDDSFLLQKNDLVAAERWLTRGPDKDPKPTALQSEFVIASRAAATRRQRRLIGAAAVATMLIGIGAIVATVQSTIADVRREEALSRRLASQSATWMEEDPALGLLLAAQAQDVSPTTTEALNAMLGALDRVRGVEAFLTGEYDSGSLALSPDGALLAVSRCAKVIEESCARSSIELWRHGPLRRTGSTELDLPVFRLAFSPDGQKLGATACCEAGSERGRSLAFEVADDGAKLVKADERPFEGWPLPEPQALFAVSAAPPDPALAERVRRASGASARAFSARRIVGTRVFVDIGGEEVYAPVRFELWDAAGAPRRLAGAKMTSSFMRETMFRPDGGLGASFGCAPAAGGRICGAAQLVILDDTGEKPSAARLGQDLDEWIRALAMLPAERWVLSGGCGKYEYQKCRYGELRLFMVDDDPLEEAASADDPPKPLGSEPMRTYGGAVESIAVSGDGKLLAVASQRGKVALMRLDGPLDAAEGWLASPLVAKRVVLPPDAPASGAPALRCAGEQVRSTTLSRAAAQLQSPAELCEVLRTFAPEGDDASIDARTVETASPSGTRLAIGGCAARNKSGGGCEKGLATVWTIADRRLARLATVDTPAAVRQLEFAPDGNLLAVASCSSASAQECTDGRLEVVDLIAPDRSPRVLAEGLGLVTAVAFQPGKQVLAYATCARLEDVGAVRGCAVGGIRVLGLPAADSVDWTLSGHRGAVYALAFSPDGALLVSGGGDGTVMLWDAKRGERLGPLMAAHAESVAVIRFRSAESFTSASTTDELEWRATPAEWKMVACRIANRTLAEGEHAHYIGEAEPFRNACAEAMPPRRSAVSRWLRRLVGAA